MITSRDDYVHHRPQSEADGERWPMSDIYAKDEDGNYLIKIDGGIMTRRSGSTGNRDAEGKIITRDKIMRGEDLCFLFEAYAAREVLTEASLLSEIHDGHSRVAFSRRISRYQMNKLIDWHNSAFFSDSEHYGRVGKWIKSGYELPEGSVTTVGGSLQQYLENNDAYYTSHPNHREGDSWRLALLTNGSDFNFVLKAEPIRKMLLSLPLLNRMLFYGFNIDHEKTPVLPSKWYDTIAEEEIDITPTSLCFYEHVKYKEGEEGEVVEDEFNYVPTPSGRAYLKINKIFDYDRHKDIQAAVLYVNISVRCDRHANSMDKDVDPVDETKTVYGFYKIGEVDIDEDGGFSIANSDLTSASSWLISNGGIDTSLPDIANPSSQLVTCNTHFISFELVATTAPRITRV